jgi:murein DD-endopeptidase MepM/ murein hydrolase activator NlpD
LSDTQKCEAFGRDGLLVRTGSPSVLRGILFFFTALIVLGGSAARPVPAPLPALGSMDIAQPELLGEPALEAAEDRGLYYSVYRVVRGDTLSEISDSFDLSLDTIVSFNNIQNARSLQPGTLLKIPNISGIMYAAMEGDEVQTVAAKHEISADRVIEANGLMSESLERGDLLFLPDAHLASIKLREISGDLFKWPVRGWITSWYGWRNDPFTGARRFHNGLDIGVDSGTSVKAPMDGYIAEMGYSDGSGNYLLLSHHGGWTSFYGHLESFSVRRGERVAVGTLLGRSGNSGRSTGPHLHFSVFKNGRSANPANVLH